MTQTSIITNSQQIPTYTPVNNATSFRATKTRQNESEVDSFIKQQEEARKKARNQQRLNTGIQIGVLAALLASVGFMFWNSGLFGKKVQQAIAKDLSKEKSIKDLALGDVLQKQTDEILLQWERADVLKEKGMKSLQPIFLYSEPGAGKNAWVYGLCKDSGAELFESNVLKFNDKFFGESENNILKFINNVIKKAEKNPNKKFVVYFDEIDSVARKDLGANAAHSEKLQNAFKTGFNELLKIPNIQIVASSNKATKEEAVTALLDEAIINRFGKKIFVPLPNSQQIKNCIINNYEKLPSKYVSQELLDKNNTTINKICDYLSQDNHHVSFRDIEDIISQARILSEKGNAKGNPISIEHLKQATLEKADQLNWSPKEIEDFKKIIS